MASTPVSPQTERSLGALLLCGLLLCLGLALAALFLLSLGVDEAWILLGIHDLVWGAEFAEVPMAPATSTGGLYALVESAIMVFARNAVWPQRLFVFLSLVAVVALLVRGTPSGPPPWAQASLVVAPLLAVPGTLVLGATAHGAVPAFLLVLLGIAAWEQASSHRVARWISCGVLLGMAAGTRLNCAAIFPALLLCAWLRRNRCSGAVFDAFVVCSIGGSLLLADLWVLGALAPEDALSKDYAAIAALTSPASVWSLLSYLVVAESFFSLPLMVVASAACWCGERAGGRLWILTVFGWLVFGTWLVFSPIPHLRYLWPGLAAFAVVLGVCLSRFYGWAREEGRPWLCASALAVALACVASALGTTARHLAYGDATLLSLEWSRWKGLDAVRTGRHLSDQQAAVRHLQAWTRPEEEVATLGFSFELQYLSKRPIRSLPQLVDLGAWNPGQLPRRLVLTPAVGSLIFLPPAGIRWFERNTQFAARIGGYSFYRVTGAYPDRPEILLATRVAHRAHPVAQRR